MLVLCALMKTGTKLYGVVCWLTLLNYCSHACRGVYLLTGSVGEKLVTGFLHFNDDG